MDYITFSQTSGEIGFVGDNGISYLIGKGWAGNGEGKNNHAMQDVRSVGPLPCGWWTIGEPENHPTVGPFALRLTPQKGTITFGRDGFLIHGAAKDPSKRGQESRGCIVADRVTREKIHGLGAKALLVTK